MRPAARAAILAGLLCAAAAGGAAAQELGRLFFTPEQRAALDARRKARVPDKPAATPQVESPVTRVNGIVQRAGGKSTVWVNGEAIPESPQARRSRGAAPCRRRPRLRAPGGRPAGTSTCAWANR